MKRVLLFTIIIVGIVFGVAISSYTTLGIFLEDGFVLQDNGVKEALVSDASPDSALSAAEVSIYDIIYSQGNSYFFGKEGGSTKTKFSSDFPQYIKGGSAVKFIDNKASLITSTFESVKGYQNLILSDGVAFNEDYSRADFNDYILLKLHNGLYINSGTMEITTVLNQYDVASNSIVYFDAKTLAYYSISNGETNYYRIEDIDLNSTIKIGDVEMDYESFLKSIGELYDAKTYTKEDPTDPTEVDDPTEPTKAEDPTSQTEESDPSDKPKTDDDKKSDDDKKTDDGKKTDGDKKSDNDSKSEGGEDTEDDSKGGKGSEVSGDEEDTEDDDSTGSGDVEKPQKPSRPERQEEVAEAEKVSEADPAKPVDPSYVPSTPADPLPGKPSKTKEDETESLYKNPEWKMPTVTVGDLFNPGVYSLKMNVKVSDPAGVIVGGITYEVCILDSHNNSEVFKRSAYSVYSATDFSIILISGLIPDSDYTVTGTYRYKDSYGRIVTDSVVFMETKSFSTKSVGDLGSVYLEDLQMENANLYGNRISIPHIKFTTESDQDAIGSMTRVILRFTEKDTASSQNPVILAVNISSSNLELLKNFQAVSGDSGKKLKSGTDYLVDIDCYDRYNNKLDVRGSSTESRTCKSAPVATVEITYTAEGETLLTATLKNEDNVPYTNLVARLYDNLGTPISFGAATEISLVDGETLQLPELSGNRSYIARVYATCDTNNGDGNTEKLIGSKNFAPFEIGTLGQLYLTMNNLSQDICPDELNQRFVMTIALNSKLTNPYLPDYVDVLTINFSCETGTVAVSLTEDELAKLKAGEQILIDTKTYVPAGLSSKTHYNVAFSAKKIYDSTNNDYVDIRVNNRFSFDTGRTPTEVLVKDVSVFQGFISLNVKVTDVDQNVKDKNVILNVYKRNADDTETLVGAHNIATNQLGFQKIKMTNDTSSSTDGIAYDILANTEYVFKFVAAEMYSNTKLETNYILNQFSKSTAVSITGKIYNGGLEDNNDGTMDATLLMEMEDLGDFLDGVTNKKTIYVDQIRNTDAGSSIVKTYTFEYTGHYLSNELGWLDSNNKFYSDDYVAANSSHYSSMLPDEAIQAGYKQVEYIKSNGSAYIDTGIIQSSAISQITITYQTTKIGSEQFLVGAENTQGKGMYVKVNSIGKGDTYSATFSTTVIGAQTLAVSNDNGISNSNIYIFAENKSGPKGFSTAKIYSVSFLKGQEPVMYLLPCVNPDGEPGFYDLVSNQFLGSKIKDSLTAGEEVRTCFDSYTQSSITAIPSRYQQLEYIENTGTSYINTGVIPTENTGILIDYHQTNSGGSMFGSCAGGGVKYYGVYDYSSGQYVYWGKQESKYSPSQGLIRKNFEFNYMNSRVTKSNGTVMYNLAEPKITTTYPMYLFRLGGTYTQYAYGKIYRCIITEGTTVIRDYYPCIDLYTGVAGLYDVVEGKFYSSATTNPFKFTAFRSSGMLKRGLNTVTTFDSSVLKDNITSNTYTYKMYFKLNAGTADEISVPISSITFSTEQEIYTIASGEEFLQKAPNKKKYVVINDISIDNTGKTTALMNDEYAEIDFQGFTFNYSANCYPIIKYIRGKITNAVLNSYAPLRRSAIIESYVTSTISYSGMLALYNYGTLSNLMITYTQEEYPYTYENNTYWSDLSPEEIQALTELAVIEAMDGSSTDPNSATVQLANSKYGFPTLNAAIVCDNYGTIENFVLDITTPVYGMNYVGGIAVGSFTNSTIRNGYVYSSTLPNNEVQLILTTKTFTNSYTGYFTAGSVAAYINGKNSIIENVYALAKVRTSTKGYNNLGILVGYNTGSGAVVRNSYAVGSTGLLSTGKPESASYGPALGVNNGGTTGSSNVYYFSENRSNNEHNLATTLVALKNVTWQSSVLNSNEDNIRFSVDANVSIGCYPQVKYTADSMPAQELIPLPTEVPASTSATDWEIVFAYTYTGDPENIYNNIIMAGISNPGKLAWKDGSEEQILCVMLDNKSQTNIYSIAINDFPEVDHDDIIYQFNDGEGLTTVYIRMHDPVRCLTNYTFSSVTFALDDLTGDTPSLVIGTKYAYMEYFWKITDEVTWKEFRQKYKSGNTCPENMSLYTDLSFEGQSFETYAWYNITYTGKVQGNNHIISGIDYDNNLASKLGMGSALSSCYNATSVGLFSTYTGTATDLTIRDSAIEAYDNVGTFAATLDGATIKNIHVENAYVGGGGQVGGIAARAIVSDVIFCGVTDCKVVNYGCGPTGYRAAGGMFGTIEDFTAVSRSFAQNVYIESISTICTGGFVGYVKVTNSGSIVGCYATGYIVDCSDFTGGFAGVIGERYKVDSCYADVDIYAYAGLNGGFTGASIGTITNVVSFGNVSNANILDSADEKVTNFSLQALRGKVAADSLTGYVFDEVKLYQDTNMDVVGTKDNIKGTDTMAGATDMSFDEYVNGKAFDLLSGEYFETAGYSSGQLPKLLDLSRQELSGQNTEYICTTDSDADISISSISVKENGVGDLAEYTLEVKIKHSNAIEIENLYTDFTHVDEFVNMCDSDGNHLGQMTFTKNSIFSEGNKSAVRTSYETYTNTTITISKLSPECALDTYWLTGIAYKKDGKTSVLRVSEKLDVPAKWKVVSSVDDWFNKVCGTHYENFKITNDLDFNNRQIHTYDGTSNVVANRFVGMRGTASDYNYDAATTPDSQKYYVISNVTIDEPTSTLNLPNGAMNMASVGLLKCVASQFECFEFNQIKLNNQYGTEVGIVGLSYGHDCGLRFKDVTINCRDRSACLSSVSGELKYVLVEQVTNKPSYSGAIYGNILAYNVPSRVFNCGVSEIIASDFYGEQLGSGYSSGGSLIGNSYYSFYAENSSRFVPNSSQCWFRNITISNSSNKQCYCRTSMCCALVFGASFDNIHVSDCSIELTRVYSNQGGGFIAGYIYAATGGNSEVKNCTVKDCVMIINSTNPYYLGGAVGRMESYNIGMSNITVSSVSVSGYYCIGGITGLTRYKVSDSTAEYCTVQGKYYYIGGAIGYGSGNSTNITVTDTNVSISSGTPLSMGGVMGYAGGGGTVTLNAKNVTVQGYQYVGGLIGYSDVYLINSSVENSKIVGDIDCVGGLVGFGYSPNAKCKVVNSTIVGKTTYVGGAVGYVNRLPATSSALPVSGDSYGAWIKNSVIVGSSYVGGAYGKITSAVTTSTIVDGCTIEGNSYVGGILGGNGTDTNDLIANSYIGNSFINQLDYTEASKYGLSTESGSFFGGVFGYASYANYCLAENCIINAEEADYVGAIGGNFNAVYTAANTNGTLVSKDCIVRGHHYVGGLFGRISPFFNSTYAQVINTNRDSDTYRSVIRDCYSNALVYGENYVAGIAGSYEASKGTAIVGSGTSRIEYANVYTLSAKVQDVYFTGALNATDEDGRVAGVFGFCDVRTQDSSAVVPGVKDTQWTIKLQGVSILASYMKAAHVDPVITEYTDTQKSIEELKEEFNFVDLTQETVPQFISLWANTDVIALNGASVKLASYINATSKTQCRPYCDTLNNVYSAYQEALATGSRDGHTKFIAIVDSDPTDNAEGNKEIISTFKSILLEDNGYYDYVTADTYSTFLAEYTPVEYVQTTGTQYFDTEYTVSPSNITTLEYVLDAEPTMDAVGNRWWANGLGSSYLTFYAGIGNGNSTSYPFTYGCGNGDISTGIYGSIGTRYTWIYSVRQRTYKVLSTNKETLVSIGSTTYRAPTQSQTMALSAWKYYSGSNGSTFSEKIYSFRLYSMDKIVRDYIPCIRNIDNQAGLYDLANDKFYPPKSTSKNVTSLIVGGPVDIRSTSVYAPQLLTGQEIIFNGHSTTGTTLDGEPLQTVYHSHVEIPSTNSTSAFQTNIDRMEDIYQAFITNNELPDDIGNQGAADTNMVEAVKQLIQVDVSDADKVKVSFTNSSTVLTTDLDNRVSVEDTIKDLSYTIIDESSGSARKVVGSNSWIVDGSIDPANMEREYTYDFTSELALVYSFKTQKGYTGTGSISITPSMSKTQWANGSYIYTITDTGSLYYYDSNDSSTCGFISHSVVNLMNGKALLKDGTIIDMVSATSTAKMIPSNIVFLKYVQANGKQYIDTGVTPFQVTKYCFRHEYTTTGYSTLYGSSISNSNWNGLLYGTGSSAGLYVGTSGWVISLYNNKDYEVLVDNYNHTISANGSIVAYSGNPENNVNIAIFAHRWSGTYTQLYVGKLYYFQIYNNDTIVRDFVPCYDKSTNKCGLYDLVTQTFFSNGHSSKVDFNAGPVLLPMQSID